VKAVDLAARKLVEQRFLLREDAADVFKPPGRPICSARTSLRHGERRSSPPASAWSGVSDSVRDVQ